MADIGGIINRLAPLIEKTVKNEYNLLINSKTEATKLDFNLKEIQKVLEEAERRRLADPRVKTWLENLQDVMYEIEDALDEWETLDLRLLFEGPDEDDVSHTWLEKVSIFIDSLCSCSKHVFRRRRMAFKIRDLNEKVDSLDKVTAKYALLPLNSDSQDVKCEITTSFSDLIEIPSQQHKKNKLVNKLLTREGEEPGDIQVISLVGMVGVGKTTLAQLAFNDPRVQSSFELKSWICISHISGMDRITKAILQSFRVSYPEDAELQTLLELIQSTVCRRKFLLVLDHISIENDSIWNQLKASLKYGAPGSRIVVTSRNENVPNLMDSTQIIKVLPLNEKNCWLLFSGIALRSRKDKEKLGDIGRSIAKKCGGLPLAAKTLGYYLQSRYSEKLWEDVLKKEVWQLDEVAKALFETLAFSYNELPLALKHCFSSWATFKKGSNVEVDKLIRIWMVQGYVETELTGLEYFEKLASSSFFQKSNEIRSGDDDLQTCKMHCILHDFARYLQKSGSKVEQGRIFYSDKLIFADELGSLKSVRLLIMTCMQELPSEIGNLVHLRYLDLSGTSIKQLPVTICNLYKLEVLGLCGCCSLRKLPEQIHRLRHLKHLLIGGNDHFIQLPQGIDKLTYLQTLDEFYVGREANEFRHLAKLNQLQGSLCINIIENLNEKEHVEDAKKADLGGKIDISNLHLFLRGEVSMDVMEALQAPPNLQFLEIRGHKGTKFPNWICTSLNKIRALNISQCDNCSELPPLGGLPFLEKFSVLDMKSLKRVGREFWGVGYDGVIFPKLKTLSFWNCGKWEEWEDITENEPNPPSMMPPPRESKDIPGDEAKTLSIMPRLEVLTIHRCHKLKALPNLLLRKATCLKQLNIFSYRLQSQYQPAGSQDWKFIIQTQQS